MTLSLYRTIVFVTVPILGFAGCSKSEPASNAKVPTHPHQHHAPHGGIPVELGDEAYHLELVADPGAGTLVAYVLDGEMEQFVRIAAPSLELTVRVGGTERSLLLRAVANPATGETLGDTSQFQAQADWLRTPMPLEGIVKEVTVRGSTFRSVSFSSQTPGANP